jgi:hypothetical protein
MKSLTWRVSIVAAVSLCLAAAATLAPRNPAMAQGIKKKKSVKEKEKDDVPPARPTDPKLIELHKEFLSKASKLAEDYERKKQHDKAREVYEAILRLVPAYPQAEQALSKIRETEATTNKKQIDVAANMTAGRGWTAGWTDTQIDLVEGKPVIISAEGKWTFKMSQELGPEGMEIPQELREFKLGALIGIIVSPDAKELKDVKPFHIGAQREFSAERSGRLLVRMYDYDPSDNVGKIKVTVQSTFAKTN